MERRYPGLGADPPEVQSSTLSTQHTALSTIEISVVVPTFKRPPLLHRCLSALTAQTLDPALYEIIVVDDGPSEETRRVVESWIERVARPQLQYVPVYHAHGPAAARNTGWRAARGRLIAFTDDDCIPAPDWLAAGCALLNEETVSAACGRIVVPVSHHPTDHERTTSGLEKVEFATANAFCTRRALLEVGGFDERFTQAWREDSDLQFSLVEHGRRCIHLPEAVVVHPVRPARWGISLSQQRNNLFNALLYKKHRALYRSRVQPDPPWRYYVMTGALALAATGTVIGSTWLVVGPLALWIGLTAQFSMERLRHTSRTIGHVAEMALTSALIPPLAVFWRIRGAVKYRVLFL
ncbi:MAG: glycosyltransferase [Nitrospiraceae bacterium]|nr:glycosyltransferase [Nitrospiraceae bacterium]